jgi:glycosyltransferase involved in cell wall biosynthesis
MSRPKISVVLCNYNHGRFLERCFGGVLAQTMPDWELVLTDDGSTDGSQEIIRHYARRDERFKVNFFSANRGPKDAYKDALARANGTYLYNGACDDFVVNKDFFRSGAAVLDTHPALSGFYGIAAIYSHEQEKAAGFMGTAETAGYNTPRQVAEGFLKCRSVVTTPSALWRHDLYHQLGGVHMEELFTALGPQMDFFLSHALALNSGIYYEKTLFACQRVYEMRTNYSSNLNLWETARRFEELERRLRPLCPAYPDIENDWVRWRAYWMVDVVRKSGVSLS